jgi:hypothetical protein
MKTCSICEKREPWSKQWSWFGSLALEECFPERLLFTCSDQCRAVADAKMQSGEIEVPQPHGQLNPACKKQKGYQDQPRNL